MKHVLLLAPFEDIFKQQLERIRSALSTGGYVLDPNRPDRTGMDARVLRTELRGLPSISVSRGTDETGECTIGHVASSLSSRIEPPDEFLRVKTAMRLIMRTAGPTTPEHVNMFCWSQTPWDAFRLQSYVSATDQTDIEPTAELADVLPPIVVARTTTDHRGDRMLTLSAHCEFAQMKDLVKMDAVETLRIMDDLKRRPLGSVPA